MFGVVNYESEVKKAKKQNGGSDMAVKYAKKNVNL